MMIVFLMMITIECGVADFVHSIGVLDFGFKNPFGVNNSGMKGWIGKWYTYSIDSILAL